MTFMPSAADERDLAASGWKTHSLKTQIVFVFLTTLEVMLFYWFAGLIGAEWLGPVVAIAYAEFLIARRRYWRTGVEQGLWLGAMLVLTRFFPEFEGNELLLAGALAIAGFRVRNAIFGALSLVALIAYLDTIHLTPHALILAFVVGIIASFATAIEWRRPSSALLISLIAFVAPVTGYLYYADAKYGALIGIAIFALGFGIANLVIGIELRTRAPLIAGAACIAIAAFEAHPLIPIASEAKFIVAGALALAIAAALMRALRNRTTGIVVTPTKPHELQEVAQMVHMAPMATPDATPDQPPPVSGGGEFGGAGASGDY